MKIVLFLTLALWSSLALSVCSNITRTNAGFGTELTSATYNLDLNTVYSRANNLPGDCITDETVTSGKILDGTIVNADISSSASIALSKIAPTNYAIAASDTGSFSTTSTTYADLTNQSVSITTIGRPVMITVVNGDITVSGSSAPAIAWIKAVRGSTDLTPERNVVSSGPTSPQITVPGGALVWYDTPTAGTYTYKLQVKSNSASVTLSIANAKLFVREL
jgi:hypothetical protein